MIVKCKCKHEVQDQTYGNGMRVCNTTTGKAPDGHVEVRCTVCGNKLIVKK